MVVVTIALCSLSLASANTTIPQGGGITTKKVFFNDQYIDFETCEGVPWWAGTEVTMEANRINTNLKINFTSESKKAAEKAWGCLDDVLREDAWERLPDNSRREFVGNPPKFFRQEIYTHK